MRLSRKLSESGFYHVVSKGEADQILFIDDEDRRCYTDLLRAACKKFSIDLRAYCLMSNHVHLLMDDSEGGLSNAMKQLNERYAEHFKRKTKRTGHVYKNRFWSEPIENEAYLLCCMRYIHNNPAAAGMCKASAYEWSSVRDYLGREGITNTGLILDMLGGRQGFIDFSRDEPPTAIPFPGSSLKNHLAEDEMTRIAQGVVGNLAVVPTLPKPTRNEKIKALAECGFSGLQISNMTGLSYNIVRGAMRNHK